MYKVYIKYIDNAKLYEQRVEKDTVQELLSFLEAFNEPFIILLECMITLKTEGV